ncbi:hypothetical protein AVEN_104137-1 [Araneus ventricosus]|uniref:Uncharacterized protein n=1 Tax=Araneus ventricosus TaxID=182803 RepID=A0A4Y2I6K6_ARAVE|nr:hypothetical protein AVEN_104137-1 [Araneus ventricosus]
MDHVIRKWRIPKDFDPVLALILGFADSRFNPGSIMFGEYGPNSVNPRIFEGRGGLVARSRSRDRRVSGSKPDSTEDPPCMGPVAR